METSIIMTPKKVMMDANEATAHVAYRTNEVIIIFPITPSSLMGELSDLWSTTGARNVWNTVPIIMEMQSEGGVAGALHGALQTGSLTTSFTASQGLLLMIPNMYKIAAELTPAVIHVSARALSYQAISIYGDHSDVMAARSTGFAFMASKSVQEAHDFALITQSATLKSRIPFIHFFDGFRTSHEINKICLINDEEIKQFIDEKFIFEHRARRLSPENPFIRGTLQNQDVYFQARESINPYYSACPDIVQKEMDKFSKLTGRSYHLFDYTGAPDAEDVLILMGSGAETAEETVRYLAQRGEKVGAVTVHLYRPFSTRHLVDSLPESVKRIAVLDRTKEAGASGEPLYLEVCASMMEASGVEHSKFAQPPVVVGGRYGLACKEFTPAMVKAVLEELKKDQPKDHFTIGIEDDLCHSSIAYSDNFSIEADDTVRCVFFGLGSDGTVGANKNSIKIIGEETDYYSQGYFVYDSKKSGSVTTSHLRFGTKPIRAPYLIEQNNASFVACHQFSFLERFEMLKFAKPNGTFLLNSLYPADEVWDQLPLEVQETIMEKKLHFYVIDANRVAHLADMGRKINTIMQTCFFAISGILPIDEAVRQIKKSIEKTYGKHGNEIVNKNCKAVDLSLENLFEVKIPGEALSKNSMRTSISSTAPQYVREVLSKIMVYEGDSLPVSALSQDGTYPSATSQWEKRNIAIEIPVWEPELCIQCGKCSLVCSHASIRQKVYDPSLLAGKPDTFKSAPAKFKEFPGCLFTVQVSPEDCTGCGLCIEVCPVKADDGSGKKALNICPQAQLRESENKNWEFFMRLPDPDRNQFNHSMVKNSQLLRPLFEFSGACAGCGETPYLKLLSQLFGDRALIANATGCSSVYGGSLPTTPWAVNAEGRGPAWSNSLFEDNAEFGLGMRLAVDKGEQIARELVKNCSEIISSELVEAILNTDQSTEIGLNRQRANVANLKKILAKSENPLASRLLSVADQLIRKSVWIVGGDGWAYDIGYGGLDHVLASGKNVNVLVLDTEVYSNTGGQASKATPRSAVAKFASDGKGHAKKDLGLIAMSYGNIYVAQVAMGANDNQTLRAFLEADSYSGPSLVIAYSHCISHGINMSQGMNQQKLAVKSGSWPLYRFNPLLAEEGKNSLVIDSPAPSISVSEYAYKETRYKMLALLDEERAESLMKLAEEDAQKRWNYLCYLASKPDNEK